MGRSPQTTDEHRRAHAAQRVAAVMKDYLAQHPAGTLRRKITEGALSPAEAYALLKEISLDPKTGVDRADLLPLILAYEISRSNHSQPLSVAVIDIDDFKQINSELTHVGADAVLHELATVLQTGTRDSDEVVPGEESIVRWGGEEFVVILVNTNAAGAHQVAERLRSMIAERFQSRRPKDQPITVSVGVAEWDSSVMTDWRALLKAADERLFTAKASGKNRVVS